MSDLTEFLLARIAEDEAAAKEALSQGIGVPEPEPWRAVGWPASEWPGPVVLLDPARVLRECEAKRRIVSRHNPVDCDGCFSGSCSDLLDLASVYADHPDHSPGWRP